MKNSLKKLQLYRIAFVFIFGTLLHFVYDWSGKMALAGIISPVNESVWEHLKLILYPTLIYAIFEYFINRSHGEKPKNFWTATFLNIVTAMLTIVVIFYFYTAFTGHSILFIDIATFLLAIIVGSCVNYAVLNSKRLPNLDLFSVAALMLLIAAFTVFTFHPPNLPIFIPPKEG